MEEQEKVMYIEDEEDYSPYCKVCESCGEDGCCSYLSCVFASIDLNKECDYGETYKGEALLRHYVYNKLWNLIEGNPMLEEILNEVTDEGLNKVEEYHKRKKQNKNGK